MNCLLAFICRCVLFAVYTVVSKTENELVTLTMFERAVVTCVQICILGVAWVLYEICAFVIKAVSVRYPYGIALEDTAVTWVLSKAKVVDKAVPFDELMGSNS